MNQLAVNAIQSELKSSIKADTQSHSFFFSLFALVAFIYSFINPFNPASANQEFQSSQFLSTKGFMVTTATTAPASTQGITTILTNRLFQKLNNTTMVFSNTASLPGIALFGATRASGLNSVAIGSFIDVTGDHSIGFGGQPVANPLSSTSSGNFTTNRLIMVGSNRSVAVGSHYPYMTNAIDSAIVGGDYVVKPTWYSSEVNQTIQNAIISAVIGGQSNSIYASTSTSNSTSNFSAVIGGKLNFIDRYVDTLRINRAIIGGHAPSTRGNFVRSDHTATVGGEENSTQFSFSVVIGGQSNNNYENYSVMLGGSSNTPYCFYSLLMAGSENSCIVALPAIGRGVTAGQGNVNTASWALASGIYSVTNSAFTGTAASLWKIGNGTSSVRSDAFHLTYAGAVTLNKTTSGSDQRLKKDITPFTTGLKAVMALKPVHFKWQRWDSDDIGLIAQEVYPIIPELVNKGDDEATDSWQDVKQPWSLNYEKISLVLINAIQEQQARIQTNQAKIAELKKRALALADKIQNHKQP